MTAIVRPAAAGGADRIGVLGLWHLGCVTAACLAEAGYEVLGVDPDAGIIEGLVRGRPPLYEPGLGELMADVSPRLRFSTDPEVLAAAKWAWVAFDTPVDDDDRADVEWVLDRAARLLEPLPEGALVVVSSQLPVGSVFALQERCAAVRGDGDLRFACIPENLRLGRALESFRSPDRIVAGVRSEADRGELAELLAPLRADVCWMRVESAEMTKHALNGFLATSVTFMNEIAGICESVGADAAEVARALKSERRVGPRAYLEPGDAFAGGTLARDIGFLCDLAERHGLPAHVFNGVARSNAAHRLWAQRKLLGLLGEETHDRRPLAGRTVAVWGLTYKPGTDTLRRSSAVELCGWLVGAGARVRAHDPAVKALPPSLAASVELCSDPAEAAAGADALVVSTAWPDYREVPTEDTLSALRRPLIIDPTGWLRAGMAAHAGLRYLCVGMAPEPIARRSHRDSEIVA
jgi:UDPglucose 6-dehydrogenase